MSAKNTSATVLIREKTLLPTGLAIESESFLPGWRIVQDIDGYGLSRAIEEAHWNFFYLAGEKKAIVFGREKSRALRRAVKQILAKRDGQRCNCLEITRVASKRFLGIPLLSVAANYRNVQERVYLVAERQADPRMPVATTPPMGTEGKKREHHVEMRTTEHPAQV
jgi:hypothetical protein